MAQISRRTLLSRSALVAGAVVGAGLGLLRPVHHKVATLPPAPPTALTDALSRQQTLLAGYQRVPTAPAALRADVTAHGQALRALLELYPGWRLAQRSAAAPSASARATASAPPGPGAPTSTAGLAASSTTLAKQLSSTATGWSASEVNAVAVVSTLASIAAALETHAAVLA